MGGPVLTLVIGPDALGDNGGVSEQSPEEPAESVEPAQVTLRRAPRFGAFIVVGGLLGAIATLVLTSLFEPDPAVGFTASFAYFLLFGVPAGLALGAVVALVADAVSRRRARTATAERGTVGEPDQES